jgi:DNA-binding IclR family transcriptional regulator
VAGNKRRTTVQSLERGLEILVAVAQADRVLGITELSRRMRLVVAAPSAARAWR